MGMRSAINLMCKQCIHDPDGGTGTWRQQVAACTAENCPLFAYRPLPYSAASDEVENQLQRRFGAKLAAKETSA